MRSDAFWSASNSMFPLLRSSSNDAFSAANASSSFSISSSSFCSLYVSFFFWLKLAAFEASDAIALNELNLFYDNGYEMCYRYLNANDEVLYTFDISLEEFKEATE
jgi:hypothetical protein